MTPQHANRSRFLHALATLATCAVISAGCGARSEADTGARDPDRPPEPPPAAAPPAPRTPPPAAPESSLGVADVGIWPDLDPKIQLALPQGVTAERVRARIDERHRMLVVSIDGVARKVYPLGGAARLPVGAQVLALRPGDRDELAGLIRAEELTSGPPGRDRDGDGIPDALDVLIGAKKTVVNADAYTREAEDYIDMAYPMGDVPRTIGVCTDVIIRAVRNAGIDIQKELHEDIRRARAAYPMVKGAGDPSIDQRRVGTLLPYFQRRWETHTARLDDPADPLRPGDIIFMDTFPGRSGPDHIGILSDRLDDRGFPLVINNWTDGTVTAEMDLLAFVPVMYRFRLPQ
ncbi:MAG TPA: DUF1287 domain-containing protein [Kofleriaceae bacterium]|nr:DUF1287 domain-containing protein [Kofleriaceae bacterium]